MFEEMLAKLKAKAAERARERADDAVKDSRDRNGDEVDGDDRSHKRSKKSKSSRRWVGSARSIMGYDIFIIVSCTSSLSRSLSSHLV